LIRTLQEAESLKLAMRDPNPVILLYPSGLSLYYFVSNLLTIFLMLVIKNYIIDDTKIHAKIEENKKKPKKSGGFSARLQKAMEEAEKQKNARKK